MKKLIPAAAYLRMSSDKQDTSIDGQRAELIAYAAKHGYQIVKWYSDEGVSGWKNKQRHGFHRLIADAAEGEFKVVLCWDQSRFSRFDPMEANYFWHQLRQGGVTLETIKEGKLDFESLGGWLSASVQQHAKNEFCKSLAHDSTRGRRLRLLSGKWSSTPPYGYRRGNDKLELGDAAEIATVQKMFSLRAKGYGFRAIAKALTEAGAKPPQSASWSQRQIRAMLFRETYIGNMVVGKNPKGKFAHVVDEPQTFENMHPPIIDRETWRAVQAMNERQRHARRGPEAGCKQIGGHLSGLLKCGNCGSPLYSVRGRRLYVCAAYHNGDGCHCNRLPFDAVLKLVADKIRAVVLGGSFEGLTAAIERELAQRSASRVTTDVAALKRQISEIDRKLAGAAERLLEVEASLVPSVRAAMLALQEKRQAMAATLEHAGAERNPKSAKEIAAGLWQLDEVLRTGDAATVRAALANIIDRVVVDFEQRPRGNKQVQSRPVGGTIFFVQKGKHVPGGTS